MNEALLQELVEAHGIASREERIREIVRRELGAICEIRVDTMGNMICRKPATAPPKKGEPRKLMIAAHMDEIGFLVKFIDSNGYLRLNPVGGWDARQMASQRVIVHTQKGDLPGVLMQSTKPKHLLKPEEMAKAPAVEDFFVDIGMSKREAERAVRIGDWVTMDRTMQKMGKLYTCKAMDDRIAVYVMIEAMKGVKNHAVDVYGVATVQEEVGLRGATTSGWSIHPDICVAIDVTLANDIPGIPESDHVTQLGRGTAIKVMDSSLICHPAMVEHFRSLAEKHKIPYQMEVLPAGGTDAGGVQRLHGGIPSFTLSVPCRYIHTVNETVHQKDVEASVKLLARYIEDAHRGDYTYR